MGFAWTSGVRIESGLKPKKCLMDIEASITQSKISKQERRNYSQNHGFVISKESIEGQSDIEITHIHLNDNTVAGIALLKTNLYFPYNIILKHQPDRTIQGTYLIHSSKI